MIVYIYFILCTKVYKTKYNQKILLLKIYILQQINLLLNINISKLLLLNINISK